MNAARRSWWRCQVAPGSISNPTLSFHLESRERAGRNGRDRHAQVHGRLKCDFELAGERVGVFQTGARLHSHAELSERLRAGDSYLVFGHAGLGADDFIDGTGENVDA